MDFDAPGRRTKILAVSAASAGSLAAGLAAFVASRVDPLIGLHAALGLLILILSISLGLRNHGGLPFLFRPPVAVAASVLVGSWAATQLAPSDYAGYMLLWSAQVVGVLVALMLMPPHVRLGRPGVRTINQDILGRLSWVVFTISGLAAGVFFAWKGVPVLGASVEQGRVDAASEGTGYFRLLAYMGIPAAHMLVALRRRHAVWVVIGTTLVILGLANRSPLLYLYVPLLMIVFDRGKIRLTTPRVLAAVAAIGMVIVSIGTFRVFSQTDFARYQEFRGDIATGDYIGVATTTFTHYAQVVTENAVLTKSLVDDGSISLQYGSTYLTLFLTALPGEQLSLDRIIKLASGKTFVGGGTPPTLMGEGYVNFGLLGAMAAGAVIVILLEYWARRYAESIESGDESLRGATAAIYGYTLCWVVGSQVAGLTGASTVPLAGAIVLVTLRAWSAKTGRRSR